MEALIIVAVLVLVGVVWYGMSRSNRSAVPVASVTPAPEPPAVEPPNPAAAMSKPGTWVLWEVVETYNSDALAGEKVGPPSVKSEWPAEIDLDRTACELVRQSKIRAAQQRSADSRYSLSENGVTFHSGEGAERKMFFEGFYCVAAPRFPPGHDRK
jgi:hypothetical protein